MTEIYQAVADCRPKFVEISNSFTKDTNEIDEVVQKGLIKYGAVVIRRSFTSVRSPYYYKYKKYYTHIDSHSSNLTYELTQRDNESNKKHLYNIPSTEEYVQWKKLEQIDKALEDFYWYDRDVFKLYYYEGH